MSKDSRSSRSHDNWFAPDPRSTGSSDKHSIQDPRSIRSSDKHSVQDPISIRSSDKHSVQDPRSIRSSDKHSVQDPRSIRSSDKRYVQDPRSLGSFDKHVDIGSKIYKIYGSWIFRILDPGSFSDHGTSLARTALWLMVRGARRTSRSVMSRVRFSPNSRQTAHRTRRSAQPDRDRDRDHRDGTGTGITGTGPGPPERDRDRDRDHRNGTGTGTGTTGTTRTGPGWTGIGITGTGPGSPERDRTGPDGTGGASGGTYCQIGTTCHRRSPLAERPRPRLYDGRCRRVSGECVTPVTWAEKFESLERINSIRETNENFDSSNSCKRLVPAVYMSYTSQNFRLFLVSNSSVVTFRICLFKYVGAHVGVWRLGPGVGRRGPAGLSAGQRSGGDSGGAARPAVRPLPAVWHQQTGGRLRGHPPDDDAAGQVSSSSSPTPYTWAEKFESFERINSIRETNGNFDSCNSCERLVPSHSHELHESKFPFVSRIEFIRSKLSNFSAHVFGVADTWLWDGIINDRVVNSLPTSRHSCDYFVMFLCRFSICPCWPMGANNGVCVCLCVMFQSAGVVAAQSLRSRGALLWPAMFGSAGIQAWPLSPPVPAVWPQRTGIARQWAVGRKWDHHRFTQCRHWHGHYQMGEICRAIGIRYCCHHLLFIIISFCDVIVVEHRSHSACYICVVPNFMDSNL